MPDDAPLDRLEEQPLRVAGAFCGVILAQSNGEVVTAVDNAGIRLDDARLGLFSNVGFSD